MRSLPPILRLILASLLAFAEVLLLVSGGRGLFAGTAAAVASPHSLALNGTSAYAEVPSAADLNLTGDWTLELWFKDESPEGYFHLPRVLLTKGDPIVDSQVPYGMVIAFGVLAVGERSGLGGRLLSYNLLQHGVSANAWHHAAATLNSSTGVLALYLDGLLVAQRAAVTTGRSGNARPVRIGRDGAGRFFWRGKLDDMRLWNVVRTAEQIRGAYLAELVGPAPAGLIANWQFDEGGGVEAQDSAGAHVAALVGGATFSLDVPSATATPSPTATATATTAPTATDTATPTATATPSPTDTATPSPTVTATATTSPTATDTATPSPTATATATTTPTATDTATPTATATPVATDVLPPDPASVAPPLDASIATDLLTSTQFLYSGASPIQTGVAPNTIDQHRVAVLRGRVQSRDGQPLGGATITIHQHPEFGQTLSRADGMFDLVVNGGGPLLLDYSRPGFLPVQRMTDTSWQDFAALQDVTLIPLDARVDTIAVNSTQPIQVARGSVVSDTDGTRQATLLFPAGTAASMRLPGGNIQPLSTLNVHATEFTVGASGPDAMPGDLPPTSAYTYAVDFSVDEANVAGATEVRFSNPLPFYVENFLNFPVGTVVPLGTYDRVNGVWVAAESGRVLKILGVTNGRASLDTDGDNQPDSPATLAAQAITDAELQQLALSYSPGQSLWRVRIPHFSSADLNFGIGPPPGAKPPSGRPRVRIVLPSNCSIFGNSSIECQNQVLDEQVGVVGTPFNLFYSSERVPGRTAAYSLEIPVSGAQLPPGVRAMLLEVRVAGQVFKQTFPAQPNFTTTFTWNGRDAYGRRLNGAQRITVRTGYTYGAVYGGPVKFGDPGTGRITGVIARQEVTLWDVWEGTIGGWDPRAIGLGGWSLGVHHAYDPQAQVLYRGDGKREPAGGITSNVSPVIGTYAGTGTASGRPADNVPATTQPLDPQGVAVGPDGSLYIANGLLLNIRRVSRDGIITTFAGSGQRCAAATDPCGDGGPAISATMDSANAIAIGPDGSVYFAGAAGRVRKIGTDGIITTVAGTGANGFSGDGGPATQAQINQSPEGLAVGRDNTLYIADTFNHRVRRVGPDGIITTFAGTGAICAPTTAACGDGGPATQALLGSPDGVALSSNGGVYIADGIGRVRLVTPDGLIQTAAGTGDVGFSGDGGPATQAIFRQTSAVAVGPDDTVYVTDVGNSRVRWFQPGGPIFTLAGTGISGTSGDNGLALQADLQAVDFGLAIAPDGSVYVSQTHNNTRVRKISSIGEEFLGGQLIVPSSDGREVYRFTPRGRHVQTLDAVTGAIRYQFGYDSGGRLTSIADAAGNTTSIEHDSSGGPLAIVGPFGQRTTLATNASGYLSQVTSPGGASVQATYTADGLLTAFSRPLGQTSHYTFDALGGIATATDPAGATRTLVRSGTNDDYTVTLTTPLGRTTVYHVEHLQSGDVRITTTDTAGAQRQVVIGKNGTHVATLPDGSSVTMQLAPDPRWGMRAPIAATSSSSIPSGKTTVATTQRSIQLSNPADPLSLSSLTDTLTINGRAYVVSYDATSRTATTVSPTGRRTTLVLDSRDLPALTQIGDLAAVSYTYDTRGRISSVAQGPVTNQRSATYSYSPSGWLAGITDALHQTVSFATDTDGRLNAMTFADGSQVRFGFDAAGNLTTLTPPGRPDHSLTYTPRDEIASYTPPLVGAENDELQFAYDADHQSLRADRPDGTSTRAQYDSAGRLSILDFINGQRTYSYDPAGRVSGITTSNGPALGFTYDGQLRTGESWSGSVAGTVSWTFDNDLRLASTAVNGANPVTVQYDNDSLATQVGALSITRSAQSQLVTGTTLGSVTDTRTYDSFGSLSAYAASQAGTGLYSGTFTRDALGRVTTRTESIGGSTHTFGYDYDAVGRLITVRQDGAVSATYGYDSNGNRSSAGAAATYDVQDRLLQQGPATFNNSRFGERLSRNVAGSITSYGYDGLSHLTGVTLPDATRIDYVLDGEGRRVGKKLNGTLVQGFLYQDSQRPIAELDGANAVVSRFVYATGAAADYMIRGGVTYRIIADAVGSPRLVVNAATGQIAQRMDYDEFGRVVLDTNPGLQPFGFGGGLYDRQTGLVHFGAREYDAETGRWMTRDPVGFSGGDTNLYAYASNDPINHVDLRGLMCRDTVTCTCLRQLKVCTAIGLAVGGGVKLAEQAEAAAPELETAAEDTLVQLGCPIGDTLIGMGAPPTLVEDAPAVSSTAADGLAGLYEAAPQVFDYAAIRAAELAQRNREVWQEILSEDAEANYLWELLESTRAERDMLGTKEAAEAFRSLVDLARAIFSLD